MGACVKQLSVMLNTICSTTATPSSARLALQRSAKVHTKHTIAFFARPVSWCPQTGCMIPLIFHDVSLHGLETLNCCRQTPEKQRWHFNKLQPPHTERYEIPRNLAQKANNLQPRASNGQGWLFCLLISSSLMFHLIDLLLRSFHVSAFYSVQQHACPAI